MLWSRCLGTEDETPAHRGKTEWPTAFDHSVKVCRPREAEGLLTEILVLFYATLEPRVDDGLSPDLKGGEQKPQTPLLSVGVDLGKCETSTCAGQRSPFCA